MKTAVINSEVLRGDIGHESAFTIKATDKAFRILSSGLYSDKILAVIRELSCNAYDSHVAAGFKDKPFQIHLPNALEPFFSVTDYGVGLDHHEIVDVYTTYFESTKTDSNEFIGALGLGSKSPFSYVESFTVISIFNGKKRTYTAYISEDGLPTIAMMGEEDTDEHNGVQVSMPVKNADFYNFKIKAQQALKFFNVLPEVVGVQNFEVPRAKYFLEGEGWHILDDQKEKAYALQGNVAYPLKLDAMNVIDEAIETVLKLPIVIEFPIGEIEVAASREDISYDKRTIANVKERVRQIYEEIPKIIEKLIENADSLWVAKAIYQKFLGSFPRLKEALNKISSTSSFKMNWQGQEFADSLFSVSAEEFKDLTIIGYTKEVYRKSLKGVHLKTFSGKITFQATPKTHILFDDLSFGAFSRISHYLNQANDGEITVYLIKRANGISKEEANELAEKLVSQLGGIQLELASKYEKPPVNRKASPLLLAYKGYGSWSSRNYSSDVWTNVAFTVEELEELDGGYYVILDRFNPQYNNKDFYQLTSFINNLKSLRFLDKESTIYGVRRTQIKKFSDAKWVNFFDYVKDKLNSQKFKDEVLDKMIGLVEMKDLQHPFPRMYLANPKNCTPFFEALNPECDLRKFLESTLEKQSRPKPANHHAVKYVMERLELDISDLTTEVDVNDEWNVIIKKYPMLHYVTAFTDLAGEFQPIVDYVHLIDKLQ